MSKRINPYELWHGSFVPEWLMPRKEISQGAKLAYARLCRYAGNDNVCKPKVSTLADQIGVSARQCRKYLNELIEHGLIEKNRRGLQQSNEYYFYEHEWMGLDSSDQDRKDSSDQEQNNSSDPSIVKESHSKESKPNPSNIPTKEEVKAYFKENGYDPSVGEQAYNYYNTSIEDNPNLKYWRDSKGNKVKSWKMKMRAVWFKDEHKLDNGSSSTPMQLV